MAASKFVVAAVVTAALSAIPPQAGEPEQRAVVPPQPAAAPGAPPSPPVVIQQMGPPLQPGMFNWATAIASVFASLAAISTVAGPIIKMVLENRNRVAELERQAAANRDGISRALNNQRNLEQTAAGFAVVGLMDAGIVREPGAAQPQPQTPAKPAGGAP